MKPRARLVLGVGCDQALRLAGYEDRGFKLYSTEQIQIAYHRVGLVDASIANVDRPDRGPFYACCAAKA